MSAKKKMIIAISSFAMILLATIVAVVAVLAAQNVTVQSSVNVSYNINDVLGGLKASYKYEGDQNYTTWKEETTLDGSTGSTITLPSQNFTLTKDKKYVIMKFEFKKKSASTENYTAQLAYANTTSSNVTVTSGTTESAITTAAAATMFNATISSAEYTAFYVKITLNSTDVDADFAGTFNWTLRNAGD